MASSSSSTTTFYVPASSGGGSVMKKIDETENELKSCYHRLETLEKNLQYRPMTMEEREAMEEDVRQLKEVLKTQEKNLKELRSENRSSMIVAVTLLICTFLFYGIYHMMFRQPKF
ncbi:unnamed protein product [Orchesella dallaii]|uniref:Coiled-coil domain-containing protein 167 n=1 Tax=Orchesella dallaii TaxID=48710 RepID=A0ABP1QF28_9HEXA